MTPSEIFIEPVSPEYVGTVARMRISFLKARTGLLSAQHFRWAAGVYFVGPFGFDKSFHYSCASSAIVARRRAAAAGVSFGSIVGGR